MNDVLERTSLTLSWDTRVFLIINSKIELANQEEPGATRNVPSLESVPRTNRRRRKID